MDLDPAEKLRQEARKAREDANESFDRSDTDGFMSQWASNTVAREKEAKALLIEQGGKAEFQVLMDKDSKIVPAKRIDTRYGTAWAVFEDPHDNRSPFTGEYINESQSPNLKTQAAALARKGYKLGLIKAPASVKSGGNRVMITYFFARKGNDPLADIEILSEDLLADEIKLENERNK